MVISKWQLGLFLVILLAASREGSRVLGARHLQEKVAKKDEAQVWRVTTSIRGEGFFDTSKREVPSCPDPLHNR
ncbi:hypothetical protein AAC387_Pa03g2331 [Persea americana]